MAASSHQPRRRLRYQYRALANATTSNQPIASFSPTKNQNVTAAPASGEMPLGPYHARTSHRFLSMLWATRVGSIHQRKDDRTEKGCTAHLGDLVMLCRNSKCWRPTTSAVGRQH